MSETNETFFIAQDGARIKVMVITTSRSAWINGRRIMGSQTPAVLMPEPTFVEYVPALVMLLLVMILILRRAGLLTNP